MNPPPLAWLRRALAAAVLAVPATAQSLSLQQLAANGPAPSARSRAAMAFDAQRGRAVLVGGDNGGAEALADAWVFADGVWAQLPGPAPRGRWDHGMVYDTRRGRLVLFGGFRPSAGHPARDAVALGELWECDGSTWQLIPTAGGPAPRGAAAMAYDPQRGCTIVFGGADATGALLADTWEWNGLAWSRSPAGPGPGARRGAAMAFDLERGEAVLFGGEDATGLLADTWVCRAGAWSQRAPNLAPAARAHAAMAFDARRGQLLLLGGATAPLQQQPAWAWDGVAWTALASPTPPAIGIAPAATYDLASQRLLVFGGESRVLTLRSFSAQTWGATLAGPLRTTIALAPARVGQLARYGYMYPPSAVNDVFLELLTAPFAGSASLPLPGLVATGRCRVDVNALLLATAGVLPPGGSCATSTIAVPNVPALAGLRFDVQALDVDLFAGYLHWADFDLAENVRAPLPQAGFTATPASGPAPLVVQFASAATFATSWAWDFDDDGRFDAFEANPRHTFHTPGSYRVRLRASGPGGTTETVQPAAVDVGPSWFTVNQQFAPAPLWAQFTATPPFPVTSWQWDLDNDGSFDATGPVANRTYAASGVYDVRLVLGTPSGPQTQVWTGCIVVGDVDPAQRLAVIVPGVFVMGSLAGAPDEQPLRAVTLSRPFWVGRFEVTQDEFAAVMGYNPAALQAATGTGNLPVESVTTGEAMAYCAALTARERAAGRLPPGYQYRLPTEAEWEYCCRAGSTTEWHTGVSLGVDEARFRTAFDPLPPGPRRIGSYAPNAFGLHDMHGNVQELCLDSYGLYAPGAVTDPFVVVAGAVHVARGGSFLAPANDCRSAARGAAVDATASTFGAQGFRVALAPILAP